MVRSSKATRGLREIRKAGEPTWNAMSEKQQVFCMAYIACLNATEAAKAAKYKNPNVSGSRLLTQKHVSAWLGKAKRKLFESREIDVHQLIKKINDGLHRDILDLLDEHGLIQTDLRNVPLRMRQQVDSVEQEVREIVDKEGNVTARQIKSKIRLISGASILQLAMEACGLKDNVTESDLVGIDWGGMTSRDEDEVDEIEEAIKNA